MTPNGFFVEWKRRTSLSACLMGSIDCMIYGSDMWKQIDLWDPLIIVHHSLHIVCGPRCLVATLKLKRLRRVFEFYAPAPCHLSITYQFKLPCAEPTEWGYINSNLFYKPCCGITSTVTLAAEGKIHLSRFNFPNLFHKILHLCISHFLFLSVIFKQALEKTIKDRRQRTVLKRHQRDKPAHVPSTPERIQSSYLQ